MTESRNGPTTQWDSHMIKARAGQMGLTLTRIARDAGLSQSRVSRGLVGADRAGAEAIAKALGIPFTVLFRGLYLNKPRRAAKAKSADAAADRANRPENSDSNRSAA